MQPNQHRILCIDNNASRNLAVYLLERIGFEVRIANSLAAGIELARTQYFDIYLVNHKLVDGEEIDSCDLLHESLPSNPILFYSTVVYPYRPVRALHCRLHGHVVKPISVCDVQKYAAKLIKEEMTPTNRIQHRLWEANVREFAQTREH
jgi:CheY-like chemotaxis protein